MKRNTNSDEFVILMHNIAWLRTHHGLTKIEMAKILGVSVKTLNKIESGVFPIQLGVSVLANVYFHFGLRPNVLLAQRLGE